MNATAGGCCSLPEAEDFRAECRALHGPLADAPPALWDAPTAFKSWTTFEVIGHLTMFNQAAAAALDGADAFTRFTEGFRRNAEQGGSTVRYTRDWLGAPSGPALLATWHAQANRLADLYRDLDPRRRLPWGRGPGMSARSAISARQMQTWAHGQAVFDLAGRLREDCDRLRNIAALGVNTCGWAFRNRGLPPPQSMPRVSLVAPLGARWSWNEASADTSVEVSAVGFCQVAAQTRNVADTQLVVRGETASAWMAIEQCFAGPPHDPPEQGVRRPVV